MKRRIRCITLTVVATLEHVATTDYLSQTALAAAGRGIYNYLKNTTMTSTFWAKARGGTEEGGGGGNTPQSSGSRQIIESLSAKHELGRKEKSKILE
jgi:hypothetical protein